MPAYLALRSQDFDGAFELDPVLTDATQRETVYDIQLHHPAVAAGSAHNQVSVIGGSDHAHDRAGWFGAMGLRQVASRCRIVFNTDAHG